MNYALNHLLLFTVFLRVFDLINIHLFHDASNIVAMESVSHRIFGIGLVCYCCMSLAIQSIVDLCNTSLYQLYVNASCVCGPLSGPLVHMSAAFLPFLGACKWYDL